MMTDKLITCMVSRVKIYSQSRCQSSSLKPFIKAIHRNLSHHRSERNERHAKHGSDWEGRNENFLPYTLCPSRHSPFNWKNSVWMVEENCSTSFCSLFLSRRCHLCSSKNSKHDMQDAKVMGAAWKLSRTPERDHLTLDHKELVRVKQCQNVNLLLLSKSSFTRARNSINLWSAQHPQELFAHWHCWPWRTSRVAQPSGKVQDKWTHVNSARFPIIHPLLVCLRMILRFPCWISSSIPPSSTSLAPSPEALENHIPGQALQRAEWLTTNFWVRWVGSTWYQFFHFLEVLIGVVYCCVFSNTFSRDPMAYGSRPCSANSLILLWLKFARVRALFCVQCLPVFGLSDSSVTQSLPVFGFLIKF